MSRSLITLRHLTPHPWDRVSVFWQRLLQWAKQKDVIIADPNARVTEGIHGTRVMVESRHPWDHPFRVSVSGRRAWVRPGYVGDAMPTIGGVHLDGVDGEGEQGPEPVLEIPDDATPGPDGRSFLCLRMLYDATKHQPRLEEDDWLTLAHVADPAAARLEEGIAVAIEPIAVLYWAGKTIGAARQIVHHNLVHSFLPGQGDGTGKHFFSAV